MHWSQEILFADGSWWFANSLKNSLIRLDPMFQECGWRVTVLGDMLGIETRTFARIIDRSLGITGKIWLRQLGSITAIELLRSGGKMEVIASQLGFANNSNFTREFKQMVGVTPSDFIKAESSRVQQLLAKR